MNHKVQKVIPALAIFEQELETRHRITISSDERLRLYDWCMETYPDDNIIALVRHLHDLYDRMRMEDAL